MLHRKTSTVDTDDEDEGKKKVSKPRKPRQPKGSKAEGELVAADFGTVDWGPPTGTIDWGPMPAEGVILDPAVIMQTSGADVQMTYTATGEESVGAAAPATMPDALLAIYAGASGQEAAAAPVDPLNASTSVSTVASVQSSEAVHAFAPSSSGKFSLRPKHPLSIRGAPTTPSGTSIASPSAPVATPSGALDADTASEAPVEMGNTSDPALAALPVPGLVHFANAAGPEYDDDYD